MLTEQHLQPRVLVLSPRVFPLNGVCLKVFLALLGYPVRLLAERQRLHLGKVDEAAVSLGPLPELLNVDHPKAAAVDLFRVDGQSAIFDPAFHLVAVGAASSVHRQQELI